MAVHRIPIPAVRLSGNLSGNFAGTFAGLIGVSAAIFAGGACAQTSIGSAAVIQNEVRGHTGGEIVRIARGDNVFLDQFVQTSSNSKAKFVFLDTTNMSVGPDSVVKLDQFVYNGNGTARAVSINASKGAFRFFSGSSAHEAYKVTTPQAVIGVRGTTYDVLIANGQTFIKLQEGAITACVRTGSACRDVDRPGQYLVVSDNAIAGPFESDRNTWDFGNLCTGGASDLCNKTRFAMNTAPPPPPSPSGGGYYRPQQPGHGGYAPQMPPRVRTTSLPPPVYVPPPRQTLPPVVRVYPQVYVPPVHVPPVYVPPQRPPNTHPPRPRPPYPGPRPKPPQEGKPYPERPGTPPILRSTGQGQYPGRWGNSRWNYSNRYVQTPRMTQNPRVTMYAPRLNAPRLQTPRMQAPRMQAPRMSAPRAQAAPRVARSSGGSRIR